MASKNDSRTKPTLEDLLRLKREERPDAVFWQDFERGLRQKQLAAIIEPRPWWLGLSILSRRMGPLALPVSAGAAAMLALVVIRQSPMDGFMQGTSVSSPEQMVQTIEQRAPASVSSAAQTPVEPANRVIDSASLAELSAPVLASAEIVESRPVDTAAPAAVEVVQTPAPAPAVVAAVVSLPAPAPTQVVNVSLTVESVDALQAMPASLQAVETAVEVAMTGGAEEPSFAAVASEMKPDLGALNPRQARLLSSATDVPQGKSLANVRDRVLKSLVDDHAVYASASRDGEDANRFSLRF